jgi:hypothetical protein
VTKEKEESGKERKAVGKNGEIKKTVFKMNALYIALPRVPG